MGAALTVRASGGMSKASAAEIWSTIGVGALFVAVMSCVAADLCEGGLGTSNGRVVSFLSSLNSALSFRRQKGALEPGSPSLSGGVPRPARDASKLHLNGAEHSDAYRVKLFSLVFIAKYGSQSLGSVMIGATPVVLRGPRHMFSWFVAVCLAQLCPGDLVYTAVSERVALTLAVRTGSALYKLRKFNFVAEFFEERRAEQTPGLYGSFAWMLLAQFVVIDGHALCSTVSTWLWLRGWTRTSRTDLKRGAVALAGRLGPVAVASFFVRCCGHDRPDAYFSHPHVSTAMKLFVLALFLYRSDVPCLTWRVWQRATDALPRRLELGDTEGTAQAYQKKHGNSPSVFRCAPPKVPGFKLD